jgi:hypothetical protein
MRKYEILLVVTQMCSAPSENNSVRLQTSLLLNRLEMTRLR